MTGYPAIAGGSQTDQVGSVFADPISSVLNYGTVAANPGNSGGPVWVDNGTPIHPQPSVVGIVSTAYRTARAVQITSSDLQTIQTWEASDSYLWDKPDLAITGLSISSTSFVAGGGATLSFHAENDGSTAAGPTVAKVYLSTDSTINASDTLLSVVTVDALQKKGALFSENAAINLPTNAASGSIG